MFQRNSLRIPTVVTMAGVLLVAAVGLTAQAVTCAPHPSASPQAVAERTESLSVEGSFSDHYDGAIFGRVVSQRTNHDGESAEYGQTEVVVDVTGVYGPPVNDPAVVVQDDPGSLNGFPFEVGSQYFIPYVETTDGLYSHLCDPISEVDESKVEHLMAVAEEHGWGVGGLDTNERAARSYNPWLTLGLGLTALSILALFLVRHRTGSPDESPE